MRALTALFVVAACWTGSPKPEPPRAPPPPPPAPDATIVRRAALYTTGVAECDAVIVAYEKLFDCDKFKGMPAEAVEAQQKGLQTMKESWHFDDEAAKQAAAPGCKAALDGLQQSAQAMGCPL
jgi:hypothetical protein